MNRKAHWENIHSETEPRDLSWFQEVPTVALRMLESLGVTLESPIIDVGGGTSRLVDHLLVKGYENVTVLDVSSVALDHSRKRLGQASQGVQWIVADLFEAKLPQVYEVWHDRAVFHFLTDVHERQEYSDKLWGALAPGGHAVIATFAEDGPSRCSGLPCVRYSPESLEAELGSDRFRLIESTQERHLTPRQQEQAFQYSVLQKR